MNAPDIDIDFLDRNTALEVLPHVAASNVVDGKFCRHPSGVYFQDIPRDPLTGYAAMTYGEAADAGYFKFDFLNNIAVYDGVRDEQHLIDLMEREPPWDFLQEPSVVHRLAQISEHVNLMRWWKPRSIDDLAIAIALIRPGKSHLVGSDRATIDAEIWQPTDDYWFKRSHAYSYAIAIVVQLNLLIEQVARDIDTNKDT